MDKYDNGKHRLDLLPRAFLEETANVLEFGSKKYSTNQWREGCDWSRYHAALLRHIIAWGEGETYDPESGLNHLAHASCSIAFLLEYARSGVGTDDRYISPVQLPLESVKKRTAIVIKNRAGILEMPRYTDAEPPMVIVYEGRTYKLDEDN